MQVVLYLIGLTEFVVPSSVECVYIGYEDGNNFSDDGYIDDNHTDNYIRKIIVLTTTTTITMLITIQIMIKIMVTIKRKYQ